MNIEGKHVVLFLAIALLMVATALGIANAGSTGGAGLSSLGIYGDPNTYINNVKLEEGSDIVISPSDAHNSLIISVGETWIVVPAGSVQGDVLYHDGTAWVRLAAGTVGYVLKTQGAGANPVWQAESDPALPSSPSQGDIVYYNGSAWAALSTGTSGHVLKTQGVGANPLWQAESDPTFPVGPNQGNILFYDGADWVSLAPGSSGYSLRTQGAGADPIWQAVVISNLDDIGDVASITEAQGQVIYYDGANWNALNPGDDGQYLKTQGAGSNPVWADVAGGGGGARAATVTVAANGAVSADEYDYQCNGTADDVEINAALTAGAGGLVVLSEGGYQITANLTVPASTHFTGTGTGTELTTTDATGITNMVIVGGNNVTISNMKLVLGAGAGDTGTRPNVVYAAAKTNIWLESLWIVGDETVDDGTVLRQNGIYFQDVDSSGISNSYVLDNKQSGICLRVGSDYNLVTGNVTNSNTQDGIFMHDASRSRVSNNNSFSNGQYGLHQFSSHYGTISGNVLVQNGAAGIYMYSCNYFTVSSNTLYWNAEGITLVSMSRFSLVGDNIVHGHVGVGITLDNTDRCTITGNFSYNAGHGLLLTNTSDNNSITGNDFCNSGDAGTHGVFIDECNDNIVSSNTFHSNDTHGIYIYRSSRNSIIGNNSAENEDGDGINVTGDDTANSDYNTLTGNVCYLNGSEGIAIVGGAYTNKNIVLSNQLISNVIAQLSDNGTATEVAHNIQV